MPKDRICPIISSPENLTPCQKNGCMWFHQAEGMAEGMGSCMLGYISFEIGQLNNNLQMISKNMSGSPFPFGRKV
jgi:hypothetical protein